MKRIIFLLLFISIIFNFCQPQVSIVGLWEGTLTYPGFETRVVISIQYIKSGQFSATVQKPDENDDVFDADSLEYDNNRLKFKVTCIDGYFHGKWNSVENKIDGIWQEKRTMRKIVFHRISTIEKESKPQTPAPPFPYYVKNVTFLNKQDSVHLAGTLTWPKQRSSCPSVILIAGGGAHDRDYSLFRHKPFLVIADHLTRFGIAVLRFDERGVGASSGNSLHATCENYARDVLAGIQFLKDFDAFKSERIGLSGHSEGGMIALLAAAETSDVEFVTLMGTPGLPGFEYQIQFEGSTGRALGMSEDMIKNRTAIQKKIFAILVENESVLAKQKIFEFYKTTYPDMTLEKLDQNISRLLSPGFKYNLLFDPVLIIHKISCPILAIYGEYDVHVPVEGNFLRMKKVLDRRMDACSKAVLIQGVNHFFQQTDDENFLDYGKIRQTISPEVLKIIHLWIQKLRS